MSDCQQYSDELFRLLAENCPGVIFLEVERKIVYASSRSFELLGYSPAEMQADDFDFSRVFGAEVSQKLKQEMIAQREKTDKPGVQKQVDLVCKDGSLRNCILSVQGVSYQGKNAYLGIITDITEMNLANRRLSESRQRYWSLFEAAADAMFLETLDGVILDCNAAAVRAYGYSRDDLLGMHARELVPGSSVASLKAVAEDLEKDDSVDLTLHVVSTGKRKDGSIFPTEVTVSPVIIDAEKLFLVTVRDISSRRELEAARKRYDHQLNQLKLLDNFSNVVNGLANDFNNLLTGIMGYSDLILRDLSPASPAREKARKIIEASRKGGEFIQQLISTTGRLPANFQCSSLVQVLREMVPDLSEMARTKGVFTCIFDENLPELLFDAGQIKIAVENLLKNLVEAVTENGRFSLALKLGDENFSGAESGYFGPPMPVGSYLAIKVTDNGEGISPENLTRIFEPFFSTRFSRRGLGLPTVLGIVRRHHGAILVKSQLEKGSEFRLLLPFAPGKSREASGRLKDAVSQSPAGTVLVVDDDEAVAEILCAQLESLGFATYQAGDGIAGIEMFKQLNSSLNLVILDLAMPGKSGKELLQELRWLNPEIPVMICTGMNEINDDLSELGVSAIIRKPFRLEQLEEALVKAQIKS